MDERDPVPQAAQGAVRGDHAGRAGSAEGEVLSPRVLVAAALLAAASSASAEARIPALTGPVVDEAGVLDAGARQRLEQLAYAARGTSGQGVQLQYLLVHSLEGEPIEDYAIRVAEAWKLGTAKEDNGVLVVVALDDRAVRIEVGNGIEGGLTDVQSSRIIRSTIVPAFQAGRFGDGLYEAGVQILSALGALPQGITAPPARRPAPGVHLGTSAILFFFVLMFLLRGLFGFGRRRRRSLWWFGGPWIGGGWGGGRGGWGGGGGLGGGGGGWGGGGGGFSGGGASGRW